MSKNTLLSNLINYISANSSGNVVIAAPSSGYALDVTGTGRFTSSITGVNATFAGTPSNTVQAAGSPYLYLNGGTGTSYTTLQQGVGKFDIYQFNGSAFVNTFTITSAGNVGIGTTSPAKPLYISSTVSDKVYLTGGTTQNGILLDAVGTSHQYYYGAGNNLLVGGDQGNLMAYDVTTGRAAVFFDTSNNIRFGTTASSEWMRITSGGFTKISNDGTYANAGSYHELRTSNTGNWTTVITNKSTVPYGILINYPTVAPNVTGDNQFMICSDSSNDKFIIWSSGSVVNRTGSYGTISDIKFKENVVDATPKLSDLMSLKVRNFNLIGESTKQIGFIAQELEEVFPNMIEESIQKNIDGEVGESYKSIKTSVLIPMLVKAIQELKAELDLLKQQ